VKTILKKKVYKTSNHKSKNEHLKIKTMNRVKILIMCLISTISIAQNKVNKLKQTNKVNKDVTVDLNTNYVQIEVDTWNKDEISVEAYLESEKLSEAELKEALKEWNLNIETSPSNVLISSKGNIDVISAYGNYDDVLKNLELSLVDLPDISEALVIPDIPNIKNFPSLPELPQMPNFPELPKLPEGVNVIKFDYDEYKENGESYLKSWSKQYEKKGGKEMRKLMEDWIVKFTESGYEEKMKKWGEDYGKRFEGKWAKDVEKWGEDFEENYKKDIEKWAESFGEKFSDEWAEKMEAWGKRMEAKGEDIERRAKAIEKRSKYMEKRAELMEKREEKIKEASKKKSEIKLKRMQALAERRQDLKTKNKATWLKKFEIGYSNKNIKRVIKIKIPKKAKLKLNVRHGELKMASLLNDIQGDISHTFLVAEHIDGSDTSINVSHSPVVINKWDMGTLNLNFVNKAHIKIADNLVLNSKSSNVSIDNLINTGIIDGSFGDLTISNLAETFKNLNLVLENSDALISIPQSVNYNLYFKGNRSKYNNIPTTQKTINNSNKEQNNDKNIIVNAKFSNVIVN